MFVFQKVDHFVSDCISQKKVEPHLWNYSLSVITQILKFPIEPFGNKSGCGPKTTPVLYTLA